MFKWWWALISLVLAGVGVFTLVAMNERSVGSTYYYVFADEGLSGGQDGGCFEGDAAIVRVTGDSIYSVSLGGGCEVMYDQGEIADGVINWEGKCRDVMDQKVSRDPSQSAYTGSSPKDITELVSLGDPQWRRGRIVGPTTSITPLNQWYASVTGGSTQEASAASRLQSGDDIDWTSYICWS